MKTLLHKRLDAFIAGDSSALTPDCAKALKDLLAAGNGCTGAGDVAVEARATGTTVAEAPMGGALSFHASGVGMAPQSPGGMLRQVASSISDVVWLREGPRMLYVNPAYEAVWGRSCASLYENADSFLEAVHPDDREWLFEHYRSSLDQKDSGFDADFRILTRDGRERWIQLQIFPVYNEDGQVYRHSAVARDITERQHMVEALRRSTVEAECLNHELQQINSQLENAIVQANEMALKAESASQTKSQFLANMSHEIRTPLNAVLGMISLIEDYPLCEEQRDYLNTVRQSSESLLDIINDILDFSKIEANKIELENIPFDPRALMRDAINLLSFRATAKKLVITGDVDADVPRMLVGDPTRLRQIIINLIGNAIKFTAKGSVTLNASLESLRDDCVTLRIDVRDTGIGIPAERLDRLFQPFSQLDSSTTRRYGGTGLGLAISSRLCSLMNGRMWAESKVGKGSSFIFTAEFHLADEKAHPAEASMPDMPDEDLPQRSPGDVRILLAEDNPVNRKVAVLLLKRAGYEPDIAENGKKAVEAFLHKHYDVVLMDVQMPEMDGITATQKLRRKLPKELQPYIVALTASAGKHDRDRCIEAGMDAFLSKPIRVNELETLLRRAPLLGQPRNGAARG